MRAAVEGVEARRAAGDRPAVLHALAGGAAGQALDGPGVLVLELDDVAELEALAEQADVVVQLLALFFVAA